MSGDQDLCLHGGAHLRGRQAEVCGEGDERQPEARHKVGTGSVYVFYSPVITKYTPDKFTRRISIWFQRRRRCRGGRWRTTGTCPGGRRWGWRY